MVMLHESDIETKEVLGWKGLHLFHFAASTCSQKTRIFLGLKGLEWSSHLIDPIKKEQHTPYYMGINPRGLVPTLVHDGQVIIESNDILGYLEEQFPEPVIIPASEDTQIQAMLTAEDDLHLDIRALTMRFVIPSFLAKRPEVDIASYEDTGSGTVGGLKDPKRAVEAKFWRDMNEHGGITDDQVKHAYERFKSVLDGYDEILRGQDYLIGNHVSVVDIAWFIYANRLKATGYPLQKLHPAVGKWFDRLASSPIFSKEIAIGGLAPMITGVLHFMQRLRGTTLEKVVARTDLSPEA